MAKEEAERLYASRMQASITQAAEEALLGIFQTSFEPLKGSLMNNFYVFIKHMLMETAQNGALVDLFDQSIERGKPSSVFMAVFTRQALMFPRFVRPVARLIRESMRKQAEEIA